MYFSGNSDVANDCNRRGIIVFVLMPTRLFKPKVGRAFPVFLVPYLTATALDACSATVSTPAAGPAVQSKGKATTKDTAEAEVGNIGNGRYQR